VGECGLRPFRSPFRYPSRSPPPHARSDNRNLPFAACGFCLGGPRQRSKSVRAALFLRKGNGPPTELLRMTVMKGVSAGLFAQAEKTGEEYFLIEGCSLRTGNIHKVIIERFSRKVVILRLFSLPFALPFSLPFSFILLPLAPDRWLFRQL
jgi:hypothetical protein